MARRLLSLIAVIGCAACSEPASTPTSPSEVTVGTQLFSGTLPVAGAKFYSYSVNTGGTVAAMLASLSPGLGGSPSTRVELGIGIPAGTGCRLLTSSVVGPALVPQLQLSQTPGVYCVSIADTGSLVSPMAFAIRISHP
ncbi:MAG: hypothetical protein ABI665_05320 [Vicinamibacterales bacterium]